MHLFLNGLSALRALRALRSGRLRMPTTWVPEDLAAPVSDPYTSWSAKRIAEGLQEYGALLAFSENRPLRIAVPSAKTRIRVRGIANTVRTRELPEGSFVRITSELSMCCPELLFAEMTSSMSPEVHVLLGMELCGRFSRDPLSPLNGSVRYNIPAVTSAERIRDYLGKLSGMRDVREALRRSEFLLDNAWSPREAIVALLIVLPLYEGGLGLGPIELNPRVQRSERVRAYNAKTSRVPDIRFCGTMVGLNYDGEDHFGLDRIARAAAELERDPGNSAKVFELEEAKKRARANIVGDKRRDRDLAAEGYRVFPVTKEDLDEPGGFERVMGQVLVSLEREKGIELLMQHRMIDGALPKRYRQQLIWSMLPGARGDALRKAMSDGSSVNAVVSEDSALRLDRRFFG